MRTMKFVNTKTGHVGVVDVPLTSGLMSVRQTTLALAVSGYVPKNSLTKAQFKAMTA
jgi:hypothetical protein